MTQLERDLLGTLKACVGVLERHGAYLNSDERRQMRRAWVLISKAQTDDLDAELLAGSRAEARGDDRV